MIPFSAEQALAYAVSIARPRCVGSGEDEKVADEIEARLRGWGYHVERQLFTFSTAPNVFLTFVILASVGLVLVMLLSQPSSSLLADVAALALLLLIVLFMPLNRVVQSLALEKNGRVLKWGKRYTTANLIATLALPTASTRWFVRGDTDSEHKVPQLYLVAHYDSKSQRMPLVVRIALFMLAIISGLMLIVLTVFNIATAFYLPIGLLTLAASVPLLFLDVGNNSPGAIDNASSVGLVLHLAEVLAQRTDWQDKLRVTILIPSAEELTLMGSVAYVTAYEQQLHELAHRNGLYILNFDGIGIDGDLYYAGRSREPDSQAGMNLLAYVRTACTELDLPLKHFGFIGALFDHIPFAQRGFDAISLIAVGRASRSVHTPRDSIERLHARGFHQAGQVAVRVIDYLIHS
jgi:hypothetical protein